MSKEIIGELPPEPSIEIILGLVGSPEISQFLGQEALSLYGGILDRTIPELTKEIIYSSGATGAESQAEKCLHLLDMLIAQHEVDELYSQKTGFKRAACSFGAPIPVKQYDSLQAEAWILKN